MGLQQIKEDAFGTIKIAKIYISKFTYTLIKTSGTT